MCSSDLEGTGVSSNALHPGLVNTSIVRSGPELVRRAIKLLASVVAKTPQQGAATQVYVATNALVENINGAFYLDCNPVRISGKHHMENEAMAEKLWVTAEEMAAGYLL